MKRTLLSAAITLMMASCVTAQNVISLPQPDKKLQATLTDALQNRHSSRTFSTEALPQETLSLVLWAANGVNRPDRKLLTAPTAINAQDISMYVCQADGAYLYDAVANTLTKVISEDIRPALAGRQESVKIAPVFILLVSDYSKFRNNAELWGPMDAGYVSQNLCLICSALNLNTVPRGIMDKEAVAKALNLSESQKPMLNHPIGYPTK